MSYFADYKLEREGKKTIETEEGFAIYMIENKQCYIEDIFVAKEYRMLGAATKIANLVENEAKLLGCTELLGSVVPATKGSTESLKALLAYGFRLLSAKENFIWFLKEIK
jgi:hypothetical protein